MSEEEKEPTQRPRLYDLAERRVVSQSTVQAKDPITEFLEQEDRDEIAEIRRLKLKTIEQRYRRELGEDGGESSEMKQGEEVAEVPAPLITTLAKMSPEEREAAVDVYTKLKMTQRMGPESIYLWPAILGTTRGAPNASTGQQVDIVDKVVNAMRAGKELAEEKGKNVTSDPIAVMQFAFDQAKSMQPQAPNGPAGSPMQDAFDMIDFFDKKGMLKKAGESTPPANNDMVQLEIEKLRTERDIKLKELDLKYGTEQKKLDVDREKANILGDGLTRIAKSAGRAFAEGEEEGEEEKREAPKEKPDAQDTATVDCPSCKKSVVIPQASQERDVVCVNCKTPLHWSPQR